MKNPKILNVTKIPKNLKHLVNEVNLQFVVASYKACLKPKKQVVSLDNELREETEKEWSHWKKIMESMRKQTPDIEFLEEIMLTNSKTKGYIRASNWSRVKTEQKA